jgi:phosphomannomutase
MTPSTIFKAYDIRGLYGSEINADTAHSIGRAFAKTIAKLSGKNVEQLALGLGRDMRLTAPELSAAYRAGMVEEGAHVVDAGMVGTEMLYYLVGSRNLDGGLMCTASHNPPEYTGAKLVEKGSLALSGDRGIDDIAKLVMEGMESTSVAPGSAEDVDIYADFHSAIMSHVDTSAFQPMKIVVDGGSGMAGPMVGPMLKQLPFEIVEYYWTPDGTFPGHEPNPLLPKNREFIINKVLEEGADLGIAFDGDADRCFFIDGAGNL